MRMHFPLVHEDRQKAYAILDASSVNWTLVRVPLIEFSDARDEIIVNTVDCLGNKISATDLADFLVEQLSEGTYFKKSPVVANA